MTSDVMTATRSLPWSAPRAPPTRPKAVYEIRGLAKVYRMGDVEVHALRGVDLDCREGTVTVLLGASGSGKSSLLNILGGLDVPSAGSMLFRGQDMTRASERELTRYGESMWASCFSSTILLPV